MRPPSRRHSRDQIVYAGRWAWASSAGGDEPDLYFDGSAFWSGLRGVRTLAKVETMPQEGWWHAKGCHCELCRPSRTRTD
jgi:hypothetical protein